MTLTPEHETEIRERAAAATEGPWLPRIDEGDVITDRTWYANIIAKVGGIAEDVTFIAHARTDLPALLAELDRVREERDVAQRELTEEKDRCHRYYLDHERLKAKFGDPDAYRSGKVHAEARMWKDAYWEAKVEGEKRVRDVWKQARDCEVHGELLRENAATIDRFDEANRELERAWDSAGGMRMRLETEVAGLHKALAEAQGERAQLADRFNQGYRSGQQEGTAQIAALESTLERERAGQQQLFSSHLAVEQEVHNLRAQLAEVRAASIVCADCEHLWKEHEEKGCLVNSAFGDCPCSAVAVTAH